MIRSFLTECEKLAAELDFSGESDRVNVGWRFHSDKLNIDPIGVELVADFSRKTRLIMFGNLSHLPRILLDDLRLILLTEIAKLNGLGFTGSGEDCALLQIFVIF